jgi:tetratricopeptide (TPR) repeat protein
VSLLVVEFPAFALQASILSSDTDSEDDGLNENKHDQTDLEDEAAPDPEETELTERLLEAAQHIEEEEWEKAKECLSEVIRIEPENGAAYQERVWVLLELGKFALALEDAEAAMRLEPDDSESYRARGAACIKLGLFEQAVADLTRYVKEEDTSTSGGDRPSRGYYLRGLAHAGLGNPRQAIKDYSRAIHRWPDWPEPYDARAEAYELVGNAKLARADRDQARRRATP